MSAASAVPATSAVPAGSIGFRDAVSLGIKSSNSIREIKIIFKPSKKVSKKRGITLIVFFISFLKSLRMNLSSNIVSNSGFSIIIIIFFNSFLSSFRLKIISLLKVIFFLGYISLSYKN